MQDKKTAEPEKVHLSVDVVFRLNGKPITVQGEFNIEDIEAGAGFTEVGRQRVVFDFTSKAQIDEFIQKLADTSRDMYELLTPKVG